MKAEELFHDKYLKAMKTMNRVSWENLKTRSKESGQHMAKIVYMGLEITASDIRQNGGWNGELYRQLQEMHGQKLLASNRHRQFNGQMTAYWLTERGFNELNKNGAIC